MLKPLHDAEPGLPGRLAAFCRQDYGGPVQVLCGAQNRDFAGRRGGERDGVISAEATMELVVDPRTHGVNRKVSNLINIMPRARHDTFVLSDSDIVVGSELSPQRHGNAGLDAGRRGDLPLSWHRRRRFMDADFGAGHQLAISAASHHRGQPWLGAAVLRRHHRAAPVDARSHRRFRRAADTLADDHAIGVAVRAEGYDVVTAPFLVGHHCFETSLLQLVRQQIRVARTIKSIYPIAYACTVITHPWPLALLGLALGSPPAALVVVAALLARVMLCGCIEWRFDLPRQNYWLIPLQDIIAFAVYVTSFFGATVHWRGADFRVMADGTLLNGQDLRGSS